MILIRCAVLVGQVGEGGRLNPDPEQGIDQGNVAVNAEITIWRSIDYAEDMKIEAEGTLDMNLLTRGIAMKGKGPFKHVTETKIRK